MAKPGKKKIVYGISFPEKTSQIAIELCAYRRNQTVEQGGLGKEQHFRNAFKLMWPQFHMHKWMDMLIHAWCTERFVIVLGHTRASKTFGTSYLGYLDYCALFLETWTSITTVTFTGLRSRMWADLMSAVETATVPCKFKVIDNSNELKIFMDDPKAKKDRKYQIEGFATSNSKDAAERIQGKHAARRRLILDEAEGLPPAIYEAESNAASAEDFISFKLANPLDRHSIFGQQYEPEGGWGSIMDTDLTWRSKKGYLVLHFDGLQSHNVVLHNKLKNGEITKKQYKKEFLPFLITPEYIESIRKSHGEDSIEWWKYVRGFPPPDGIVSRVFPEVVIDRMTRDIVFDLEPAKAACLDPAFEHDDCVLQLVEFGNLRNRKVGCQFVKSVKVKTKSGRGYEPKDYQIARQVIEICKDFGVSPENFIMDKTGNGRGVFAIIQRLWYEDPDNPDSVTPIAPINGVEFGGTPSDRPIRVGDTDIPKDIYCYFVDELWFRAKAWGEDGLIGGLDNLDDCTKQDLGGRIYTLKQTKQRLLDKADMKKINGRSPDFGDAFILISELMAFKGIYAGDTSTVEDPGTAFMYEDPGKSDLWDHTRKRAQVLSGLHDDDADDAFSYHDEE